MIRGKILVAIGLAAILALASAAQMNERQEGGPPPVVVVQPQPQRAVGSDPFPAMRMREYAEQLRTRAREAQELADRLRRQADEFDQMAKQQMDRGRGPQDRERMQRDLGGIQEAIGRAEREGRWQEAAALRQRTDQLQGRFQPMPPEVQDILRSAEQAEREGRIEDARRQREKAEIVARQLLEQRGRQASPQPGPRGEELQGIKQKIERLRDEARKAKEQSRFEDADRQWKEADRLEQQLREQGPRPKGESGKPMPPEVQEILRSAEQAEREGRVDDARRQREKAEVVARQFQEQKRQNVKPPGPQLKDELIRSMEEIKKEIGRLWQAVNEIRNRPKEDRPM
jgi:hypothetical protein